jgi:branched-subunit amino acid aminotransferase/4-amino-4-deoxychorismate lyase
VSRRALRAWVDGDLLPAERAVVSVYDRGFRTGEGVFETLRAYGDHVFRLEAHLRRARAGANELGFDPGPGERLAEAVWATTLGNLAAFDGADTAVRLTVSAGPVEPDSPIPGRPAGPATVVVTSHPLAPRPASMTAVSVDLARELPHVKAVSYLVAVTARRQAAERGADEALLTDGTGRVLEGASSNVFAVLDGVLVTPGTDDGLLAGVTRQVVLELARAAGVPVAQRPLELAEFRGADEAFLTSTTRELVPLVAVDGAPLRHDGGPGPVTARLQEAYAAEVRRERGAAPPEG